MLRHKISHLLEVDGDKPARKRLTGAPSATSKLVGPRCARPGKLYLFVAIDRISKFAFVELVERADMQAAAAFLQALIATVPYRIHAMLTENGIQFADLPKNRKRTNGPLARSSF